jgi:hypothetical protein
MTTVHVVVASFTEADGELQTEVIAACAVRQDAIKAMANDILDRTGSEGYTCTSPGKYVDKDLYCTYTLTSLPLQGA